MLRSFWRFGFRLLYNECAFTYDLVSRAVSLGKWRCWQRSVMQFLPPPDAGPVLELAHGTGDLQIDLQKAGYRTIGLDLSRNMGPLAQRKLYRHRLRAALLRGEAARLPFESASVAALVCSFPTSFIFDRQSTAEIRRVLKRGGLAVIVLNGLLTGNGVIEKFIGGLYRFSGQDYGAIDEEGICERFRASGLSVEAHTLPMEGSLAQIVLLKKVSAEAKAECNESLDLARES